MLWLACTTPDPVDTVEEAAVDTDPPPVHDSGDTAVDTGSGCEDAQELSWSSFGHGFFRTWCTSCHAEAAADRHGAPAGIDFDTEEQVAAWSDAIRRTVIDDATMPMGGGVYDDDLELLDEYLRCGVESDPTDDYAGERPDPSLTAEEVGAALDALLALGLPDANSIAVQYMAMFSGRDNNCPGNDGYTLPGNFRGCETNSGWIYAGVAGLEYQSDGNSLTIDMTGDCWISDAQGDTWVGAGEVTYDGTWDEGVATWEAEVYGTFGYPDADQAWLAEVPSQVFWTSGQNGDDWWLDWQGSLSTDDGAYYLEDGSFGAACGASGTLSLRGEQGYWYELVLDDGCDGCGQVSWGDEALGSVCVELPAAGAELFDRSLPGDGTW